MVAGIAAADGGDDAELVVVEAGGEHHAFGEAEAHLARLEVGDDHDEGSIESGGIGIRGADAREDRALAEGAEVDREADELVRAFDGLGLLDAGDAQIDVPEGGDVDLGLERRRGLLFEIVRVRRDRPATWAREF